MSVAALALQRNKYRHLSDDEWRWFLQQVEGRERTADKLPTFASIPDWWYPVRLSCEQCSSELTAKYKASIIAKSQQLTANSRSTMVDLTGGYGVDTYFLSEHFAHTDYVEQNAELCRIMEHNKGLRDTGDGFREIAVHNSTAENFLLTAGQYDLIFLDPARRDSHGGKVFRLEDCTPNVVELMPTLLQHLTSEGRLMLKLSPMLDITQAIKTLAVSYLPLAWDVHVVAIKNEVKEVLLLNHNPSPVTRVPSITAIDLSKKDQAFVFTREEESAANSLPYREGLGVGFFLYEPNVAILKAGAYKLIAQRFGLRKLDINTHLYASDTLVHDFPGRVWRIKEQSTNQQSKIKNQKSKITNANVLVRNYPLTAEQLKKKMHLRDGGEKYLIGARVNGKPTLFWAQRWTTND